MDRLLDDAVGKLRQETMLSRDRWITRWPQLRTVTEPSLKAAGSWLYRSGRDRFIPPR